MNLVQLSSPKAKVTKIVKTPTTPPGTPPESPTLTTAPADTTAHRRDEEHLLGREDPSAGPSSQQSKIREMFRMKVGDENLIINPSLLRVTNINFVLTASTHYQ